MFDPYPDTDPRSWSYKRTYTRPKISLTSLICNIGFTLVFTVLLFFLCRIYFLFSPFYSVFVSGSFLCTYCLLRLKSIVIWCVKCYQRFAPISVRCMCRFEPSCSEYMILAIEKFGTIKGIRKGINRIIRCSQKDGGFDYP